MRILRFELTLLLLGFVLGEEDTKPLEPKHLKEELQDEASARDYGHEAHDTGYGHDPHLSGYDPHPPKKCHPQTITKYKTIHKPRKANVVNQVEFLNPRPHLKKVTETRYTTIRYPVFITQVIKPLLTQVETKVKPVFFTKTIDKYTTVLFTVTGIGQVTVTTVKYEKEYITRCMKKGYHRSYGPEEGPTVKEEEIPLPLEPHHEGKGTEISPGVEIPYLDAFKEFDSKDSSYPEEILERDGIIPPMKKRIRTPTRKIPYNEAPVRRPHRRFINPRRRKPNRKGYLENPEFRGRIGNVGELYDEEVYYQGSERKKKLLEASSLDDVTNDSANPHPQLKTIPLEILE